jgi:C-terminal processing protease CtpA/Prc
VNGGDPMNCYSGKVVIIVNNRTISQSEYTVMALASRPNTIVIGDTTAGTDGDVSEIKLPGGISSYMSGLGILYPDGRQTQKVGVNIDKIVRPTLKGILAGKDEQLDEAISLINNQ